jgi:uncharacterized protein with PIN domain
MEKLRTAWFIFHGALKDFRPSQERELPAVLSFQPGQTCKHLIESLGAPHTEVQQVLVNGVEVDLSYQVGDGDRVEVHPAAKGQLWEKDASRLRFVLDNHLGKLAVYLRMLGFDALYRNNYDDEALAEICEQQERILLTRDRRLLMRSQVQRGYWLHSKTPRLQVLEVAQRYGLLPHIRPFYRCMGCNTPLQPVEKEAVLHRLEPLTRRYFDEFRICPGCDRVYWKGSHYQRMSRFLEEIGSELSKLEEGADQLPVGDQVVDADADQQHPADGIDEA